MTNGRQYKHAKWNGRPNYVSGDPSLPFPQNPLFKSQPILDDQARELIWTKILQKGETIKAVSAELGVDINRVAAVVRLKEVEKDFISKVRKTPTPIPISINTLLCHPCLYDDCFKHFD